MKSGPRRAAFCDTLGLDLGTDLPTHLLRGKVADIIQLRPLGLLRRGDDLDLLDDRRVQRIHLFYTDAGNRGADRYRSTGLFSMLPGKNDTFEDARLRVMNADLRACPDLFEDFFLDHNGNSVPSFTFYCQGFEAAKGLF